MERCRLFLATKSPEVSRRAARTITRQLELLEDHPLMGRPLSDQPELRELIVPFGDSGDLALYRYEPETDVVAVLTFRHQKEVGGDGASGL